MSILQEKVNSAAKVRCAGREKTWVWKKNMPKIKQKNMSFFKAERKSKNFSEEKNLPCNFCSNATLVLQKKNLVVIP